MSDLPNDLDFQLLSFHGVVTARYISMLPIRQCKACGQPTSSRSTLPVGRTPTGRYRLLAPISVSLVEWEADLSAKSLLITNTCVQREPHSFTAILECPQREPVNSTSTSTSTTTASSLATSFQTVSPEQPFITSSDEQKEPSCSGCGSRTPIYCTITNMGQITLLDHRYQVLSTLDTKTRRSIHASFHPCRDLLLVQSDLVGGSVNVISYSTEVPSLKLERSLPGYLFATWNANGDIFCIRESKEDRPFELCTISSITGEILSSVELPDMRTVSVAVPNELDLIAIACTSTSSELLVCRMSDCTVLHRFANQSLTQPRALLFRGSRLVVPSTSGQYHCYVDGVATGYFEAPSCSAYGLAWAEEDHCLWVASESGLFIWQVHFHPLLKHRPFIPVAADSVAPTDSSPSSPTSAAQPTLLGADAELNSELVRNSSVRLHVPGHSITCCGCAFSPAGSLVASADFGGNIHLWHSDQSAATPLLSINVGFVPIRALVWHPTDVAQLFVGHTDGTLSRCVLGNLSQLQLWAAGSSIGAPSVVTTASSACALASAPSAVPHTAQSVVRRADLPHLSSISRVAELSGAITCLRWSHQNDAALGAGSGTATVERRPTPRRMCSSLPPLRLAVCTSDGDLLVYEERASADVAQGTRSLALLFSFKAHCPVEPVEGEFDPKFGSLRKYAEIWSCAWSPDNHYLATCSEDQTTRVWNCDSGALLHTLRGHTTAVTTVDWRHTALGELLVTGADDQTLMVWRCDREHNHGDDEVKSRSALSFCLVHTFCTSKLLQWHTVTYLALMERSPFVVAVTQNGYVCVWDLVSKKEIFMYHLHSASIEGLVWHCTGRLVTVSSDCTANVFRLTGVKPSDCLELDC